MEIPRAALAASRWSYIALGHYHVHQRIEDNAYYSGSLEYTSTNPWSELEQEARLGFRARASSSTTSTMRSTRSITSRRAAHS